MIEVTAEPIVRIIHPKDPETWIEVALPNSVEETLQTAELSKYTHVVAVKDQDGGIVFDSETHQPVTARLPVLPPSAFENMFARRIRGWGGIAMKGVEIPFPDEAARKKDPKWWHILGSPALGFRRDIPVMNDDGSPKIDTKTGAPVVLKNRWQSFIDYAFEKARLDGPQESEAQGNG